MHTFDSKFRYMITIIIVAKMTPFITRLGFRAGALCSHQGVHVLNLHHPLDVNFNNPYKHLSSIVPPKTRILGPQKGDLLAPRNQNLRDKSSYIRLSVDPFKPMHIIHFPKVIIYIYKPNQKLDGGG